MRRVFITGYGLITAYGKSWEAVKRGFASGRSAVRYMSEWDRYADLVTRLAAPCDGWAPPKSWSRKQMRSMGRVGAMSVEAAVAALEMAGLANDPSITDGRMGVAAGSSTGSTDAIASMARLLLTGQSDCNANTYIKMMPHTTAANIALFLGLKGRVIPTSSACTSASHAIGYAYEAIKYGQIDSMIAGGAEELCASEAYVFDTLYATSTKNSAPAVTPAPFDAGRDGLVLGEGAGYVVMESEEAMRARGGRPIAEVVGFGSTCDGTHITQPNSATMRAAMELSLLSTATSSLSHASKAAMLTTLRTLPRCHAAGARPSDFSGGDFLNLKDSGMVLPSQIGYINAHATATSLGDIAETRATAELFGPGVAISSTKSYLGHTLGACGAQEAIFAIEMMRDGAFFGTLNLKNIDENCADLNYLRVDTDGGFNAPVPIKTDFVMSNNFAFGGVNTSLIFRRAD